MRVTALAAAMGAAFLVVGVAAADTWTDPAGRLTFNKPSGWQVEVQGNGAQQTAVLAFNASNDCYFFSIPNAASANSSADAAHRTTTPLTPDAWIAASNAGALHRDFFPNGAPTVVSSTVDTSGYWPVQRAQLQGARTVFAAIEVRPGFELRAFCAATSGGSAATYDPIFASLGHPNDAAWEAAANEQASQRQAAADAAAAQQTAQQQAQQTPAEDPNAHGRNGRDRREGPALSPH